MCYLLVIVQEKADIIQDVNNVIGIKKEAKMATNPPSNDNHRNGAVRSRSQTFNPRTQQFVKRNVETGHFMNVKQNGMPFKGGRQEK